jgi:hypothetical protein
MSIPLLSCSLSIVLLGSVAIMTKAYPNVERSELILIQEIATYMLLVCGAVYIIAVSLPSFARSCFVCASITAFSIISDSLNATTVGCEIS